MFLNTIDHIFTSTKAEAETAILSLRPSQIKILEMSEKDIENGDLISEEGLDKMDTQLEKPKI